MGKDIRPGRFPPGLPSDREPNIAIHVESKQVREPIPDFQPTNERHRNSTTGSDGQDSGQSAHNL